MSARRMDAGFFSIVAVVGLIAASAASFAQAAVGGDFRGLQSQAMGRTGVASSSGPMSLFLNPAALAGENGGSMGLSADVGVNSVLLDYAAWAAENNQYLNNMDSLSSRIGPVDNKWAPFSQTLALYGSYQGVAFAALSDTRYDLTIGKAVVTPVVGVGALSDLVLTAGKGFEGPDGFHFGVSLKYIYRLTFEDQLVGTTDEPFYVVKDAWTKPNTGIWSQITKLGVASDLAKTQQGVGANLGAQKDVDSNWTAGISLIDFPTILGSELVRPDVNIGLSYHRPLHLVDEIGNKLTVNLDYQKFLIPGTPWWKQLKTGVALEGYMGRRPVSYIALGLNDGYPTFGVRVGYIVYLSYVYIAEETGTYPGQQKLSFHKVALQLEM